jgi:hypothetical protein
MRIRSITVFGNRRNRREIEIYATILVKVDIGGRKQNFRCKQTFFSNFAEVFTKNNVWNIIDTFHPSLG